MKVNPIPTIVRNELNLRQGIKSSLPNMKFLFASVYTLFKISPSSKFIFTSQTTTSSKTSISLLNSLEPNLYGFFNNQLTSSGISQSVLLSSFNKSPLFIAQLEALQVAIQLFWKLGEINFAKDLPSSTERTGGDRLDKEISFSTNLDILDSILSDESNILHINSINLIFNYLTGSSLPVGNIEDKLIKILTVFSEEAHFKIRDTTLNEVFFQQEGIYSELIQSNTVISNDSKEPVGPFRILKNAVSENLNSFFEDNTAYGFQIKSGVILYDLENYLIRVSTSLDLNPRNSNIIIYNDVYLPKSGSPIIEQKIYFGAPGTGKSHKVKEITNSLSKDFWERITFHPEFDYASFVGGYKPITKKVKISKVGDPDEFKDEIQYKFVPQTFTNIYINAWNDPEKVYYLIIEEINRGNCAEIFGDIFQLLDRTSDYTVTPSKELKKHLIKKLGAGHEGIVDGLKLPDNLNILATMNTSDQSLFPMDSAFKRRWDWIYVPINYESTYEDEDGKTTDNKSFNYLIVDSYGNKKFEWINFIKTVNEIIKHNENLGMDKCIGNFFVKPADDKTISLNVFINKVIFYLWNDVFKDEEESKNIFPKGLFYEDFFPIKDEGLKKLDEVIMKINKIALVEKYEEIIWSK